MPAVLDVERVLGIHLRISVDSCPAAQRSRGASISNWPRNPFRPYASRCLFVWVKVVLRHELLHVLVVCSSKLRKEHVVQRGVLTARNHHHTFGSGCRIRGVYFTPCDLAGPLLRIHARAQ